MDPFEYVKSIAEFWTQGSKAVLSAQDAAIRALGPGQFPALAGQALDMAELARAGEAATELWRSAASLAQAMVQTLPKGGTGDPTVEATFRKMADPRSWLSVTGEMDEVLGRLAEGPRLADLWDVERKYARVQRAFLSVRQRGLEQMSVVLAAWQRAAQLFAGEIGRTGAPSRDYDAVLRLWIDTANEVLLEMQRSEAFLEAQAQLIRASTELKLAQRDLSEYYGERFGFPTRRELDDVYKTVTELRRELRAMRRAGNSSPHPARSARKPRS